MRIRRLAWPLLAGAALLAGACAKEATDFSAGVEPWEVPASASAEWPPVPTTPGTVTLLTGSRLATGATPSHSWAHGRLVLTAPLADVWAALQWRPGVLVAVAPDKTTDCEPTDRPEPEYELSYGVKEIPNGHGDLGRANWFRVNWRGATIRDAAGAIQKAEREGAEGGRYLLHRAHAPVGGGDADFQEGGRSSRWCRQINAPDESPTKAGEWIELWVAALQGQLAGIPPLPESHCFP